MRSKDLNLSLQRYVMWTGCGFLLESFSSDDLKHPPIIVAKSGYVIVGRTPIRSIFLFLMFMSKCCCSCLIVDVHV